MYYIINTYKNRIESTTCYFSFGWFKTNTQIMPFSNFHLILQSSYSSAKININLFISFLSQFNDHAIIFVLIVGEYTGTFYPFININPTRDSGNVRSTTTKSFSWIKRCTTIFCYHLRPYSMKIHRSLMSLKFVQIRYIYRNGRVIRVFWKQRSVLLYFSRKQNQIIGH